MIPIPLSDPTFNHFSLSLHFCKAARSRSLIHVAIGMYLYIVHIYVHYPYLRPAFCSLKSLLCVMTSTTYLIWAMYPCVRTGTPSRSYRSCPHLLTSHQTPQSPERVEPPSRHECQRIVWAAVFFFFFLRFSAFRPTAHQRLKMLSKNQAGMPSSPAMSHLFQYDTTYYAHGQLMSHFPTEQSRENTSHHN